MNEHETNDSTAAFQAALMGNSHELVTALTRRCEILTATNVSLTDDLLRLRQTVRRLKNSNRKSRRT